MAAAREPAGVLVVVFPELAADPPLLAATIHRFVGATAVVISKLGVRREKLPPALDAALTELAGRCRVLEFGSQQFGNRSGLASPMDLALRLLREAGLDPARHTLLLTGCYRGERPGSIDILGEALATLHVMLAIDPGVPEG